MTAPSHDSLHIAASMVARGLAYFRLEPGDEALADRINAYSKQTGQPFLVAACAAGLKCTPRVWAGYLLAQIKGWEKKERRDQFEILTEYRPHLTSSGEAALNELIDSTLRALVVISKARDDASFSGENKLAIALLECAQAMESCGAPDQAYDIAVAALDMAPEMGPETEALAKFGIENATRVGRMHQVLICKGKLAVAVMRDAASNGARKLEAFELLEEVVEALSLAPEKFRRPLLAMLMPAVESADFARILRIQLGSYLPVERRDPKYQDLVGAGTWPARIAANPPLDWIFTVLQRPTSEVEREVDSSRMELETPPDTEIAVADWTDWTIRHPAYRRAVPQNQSFLREADFDKQLMVLVHETTHILSFLGPVGIALSALRVALCENELTLWSNVVQSGEEIEARMPVEGIASPSPGDAIALLRVERRLEFVEKARVLQDVWLSWMEGLALLAESAADPKLDPTGISPVLESLRGLVDLFVNAETEGEARLKIEKLHADFEDKCHAAMENIGAIRLSAHLRHLNGAPYFQGYLAVRSVVQTWERTLGRPLLGTEAFALALHATRHGTMSALPDLSLSLDRFLDSALNGHIHWIRAVAACPKEDLEQFLAPAAANESRDSYLWSEGRLLRSTASRDETMKIEIALRSRLLEEALGSSIEEQFAADSERGNGDRSEWAARTMAAVLRNGAKPNREKLGLDYLGMLDQILTAGTLMPIGSASARFNLALPTKETGTYLAFYVRTTEKLERTGQPSGNGMAFKIDEKSGMDLQAEYRKRLSPRLQITRCVDTGGLVHDGIRGGNHLLVFSYGDWLLVRGASPPIQAMLEEDPGRYEAITDFVRFRVCPTPMQLAERALIAPGHLAISQTAKWLDTSQVWEMADQPVNVDAWVKRVTTRCKELQSTDRRVRQFSFAESLLAGIWSDPAAAAIVARGFDSLTERAPALRKPLLAWLYESGKRAPNVACSLEVDSTAENIMTSFATHGPAGWAVRPVAN
jgi:hypothetical protein